MSNRLWFRLEDVLPLAEHALACPTHRITGAQAAAGAPNGPALTLVYASTSGVLHSNGVPVWYDAHGEQHAARSVSWLPTPSGSAATLTVFLPLQHRGGDHRRLIDVLRAARDLDRQWLFIHPHARRGEVFGTGTVRVLDHRDDIAPPGTRWRLRMVTSPQVGDRSYPALVADGYTTSHESRICRFAGHCPPDRRRPQRPVAVRQHARGASAVAL